MEHFRGDAGASGVETWESWWSPSLGTMLVALSGDFLFLMHLFMRNSSSCLLTLLPSFVWGAGNLRQI